MRAIFGAVPLTVSFVLGSAAHAATVKVVEDEVFIGGVDGYERVSGTTQARVGDSVMAGEFGAGQIIYANGCVITVTPGAVVSVEARAPIVVQDPSGMVLASSARSRGRTIHSPRSCRHRGCGRDWCCHLLLDQGGGDDQPASP